MRTFFTAIVVIFVFFLSIAHAQEPIAEWWFNENGVYGDIVVDHSPAGYNNDITLNGNVTWTPEEVYFDGATTWGTVADNDHFTFYDALTVHSIVTLNSIADRQTIIRHHMQTGENEGWLFRVNAGHVYGEVKIDGINYCVVGDIELEINEEYELSMVWSNNSLKLYVNGVPDGIIATTGTGINSSSDITISRLSADYNAEYFNGWINNLVVLDYEDIPYSTLTVNIEPNNPPVIVPASGGPFWFNLAIENRTGETVPGTAWLEAVLPNGNIYGPIQQVNLALAPGQVVQPQNPMMQFVPGDAPTGNYQYRLKFGDYPDYIAMDYFEFEKLPGAALANMSDNWDCFGWGFEGGDDMIDSGLQPSAYSIDRISPNPFNPVTNITITLPEVANLKVDVYNALGRHVATLASGSYNAGYHSFRFSGSDLASGIYFVQATVPGRMNEMRKVVLMK